MAESHRQTVDDLFEREPHQWGLRGDPAVWASMREHLQGVQMPQHASALQSLLEKTFHEVVGVDLRNFTDDSVYREEFDRGGMSGGGVDLPTWRDRLIPILVDRSTLS